MGSLTLTYCDNDNGAYQVGRLMQTIYLEENAHAKYAKFRNYVGVGASDGLNLGKAADLPYSRLTNVTCPDGFKYDDNDHHNDINTYVSAWLSIEADESYDVLTLNFSSSKTDTSVPLLTSEFCDLENLKFNSTWDMVEIQSESGGYIQDDSTMAQGIDYDCDNPTENIWEIRVHTDGDRTHSRRSQGYLDVTLIIEDKVFERQVVRADFKVEGKGYSN